MSDRVDFGGVALDAVPPRRAGRGAAVSWLPFVLGAALALAAYLAAVPLFVLIASSVNASGAHLPFETGVVTLANYAAVLGDPSTYRLLGNSAVFAIGSTVLGLAIAVFFSWLIERTDIPARRFLFVAVLIPMAIPNMIYTTSWLQLLDAHTGLVQVTFQQLGVPFPALDILSLGGMIFIQGIALASHAYLLIAAAFQTVDPTWEEQSAISGKGRFATLRRVTLPVLRPALLSVVIFFLMVCIETFDVPGMVGLSAGIQVLSTRIYWATHPEGGQLPDYGVASALALILVVIAFALIQLYQAQLKRGRRYVTITARGFRPKRVALGGWRLPLLLVALALLFVMVALPLFMLVWRSLLHYYVYPSLAALGLVGLDAYRDLIDEPQVPAAVANTAIMAAATAAFTVGFSMLAAWLTVRAPIGGGWRRLLRTIVLLPQAVPSVVIGVAFMITYLRVPVPIYGTVWIIALALATKFMAYTTGSLSAAQIQVAGELEEAALIAGAGQFKTYRRIMMPLMAPALLNCTLWVVIHAIRELVIALTLYSPSAQVLSTQVWGLWQGGQIDDLCALGVMLALLLAVLLTLPSIVTQAAAVVRGARR
ncbi:MAG TPA: iron ABC transporter permease [Stellaceae bacterium]|nr:iron ABC transporter permease [Stellaceae bacterium]